MLAQAFRDIVRVEHAVERQSAEPVLHFADKLLGAQTVEIAQADRGVRAVADAQKGEFEPRIAHPAADEREIGHEALGKALARTGQHPFVLRLVRRAPGEAFGVDDERTRVPLGENERVAVEKGGERLVGVRLDPAVVRL